MSTLTKEMLDKLKEVLETVPKTPVPTTLKLSKETFERFFSKIVYRFESKADTITSNVDKLNSLILASVSLGRAGIAVRYLNLPLGYVYIEYTDKTLQVINLMKPMINIETLFSYKDEGMLRCQRHPTQPLLIWNYTEKVQYNNLWDEVTLKCRGLVTDQDGTVVARGFNKFFNIEEGKHRETDSFEIYDKMDGSLGVIFFYEYWQVATRGSFTSSQSAMAQSMLVAHDLDKLDKSLTYLVEIIYPENRIVVDYGDKKSLVLLAIMDPHGQEKDILECDVFERVKKFDYKDHKEIQKLNWDNSEGFIVRFSNGDRCKIKFENYVDLHRKLSNISEKATWELLLENRDVKEFLDIIPDEFHKQVQGWYSDLCDKYGILKRSVQHDYKTALNNLREECEKVGISNLFPKHIMKDRELKKKFAISIQDNPNKGMLFSLLAGKDIHESICDLIKPENSLSLIFDKE